MNLNDYFKEMVGEGIFIRTVTFHYVGEIKELCFNNAGDLTAIGLHKACWIYDSGDNFENIMKTQRFKKVERYVPESVVFITFASMVDWIKWDKSVLPL